MAKVIVSDYLKDVDKVRRELRALISNKISAPIRLLLAWHDAGTYDVNTKTGGPNGSIRNEEEHAHGANSGLEIALDFCEQVKSKCPKITSADLYQLAGVVAVEVTGGPAINFVPGREDSKISLKEGRLHYAKNGVRHLKEVFYRMDLSHNNIVALSGGHTLGRAHPERSGFDGPWTAEPLKLDNSYFVELLKGESEGLLKLPTDVALLDDLEFRRYVELYPKAEVHGFQRDGCLRLQARSHMYDKIMHSLPAHYMFIRIPGYAASLESLTFARRIRVPYEDEENEPENEPDVPPAGGHDIPDAEPPVVDHDPIPPVDWTARLKNLTIASVMLGVFLRLHYLDEVMVEAKAALADWRAAGCPAFMKVDLFPRTGDTTIDFSLFKFRIGLWGI